MAENSMMMAADMGSATLTSIVGEEGFDQLDKMGVQKISVSEETNSLKFSNMKSDDSFVLDMERFSHLADKDMSANSRITRNLSRKWQGRVGEKNTTNSTATNEKDNAINHASSPRGGGVSTLGKPITVPMGATDHHYHHHQITIVTGNIGNTSPTPIPTTTTTAESRLVGRRTSFRRSWIIDPRRILLFFATLSSIGSILLIYFTLSIGKA